MLARHLWIPVGGATRYEVFAVLAARSSGRSSAPASARSSWRPSARSRPSTIGQVLASLRNYSKP